MTELRFIVPGKPVTWKRTNTLNGRRITPKEQREYQAHIAFCASVIRPGTWPMDRKYKVRLEVHQANRRRSDLDNYMKNFGDALNGVLWDDDSQVDAIEVERFYCEMPRAVVTVEVIS